MKKILALVLSLMMMFSLVSASAEGFEEYFPGTWVKFEDGFEVYLPSDWLQLEVTEDDLASGIFYSFCSPDATKLGQIAWAGLEAEVTLEELQSAFPGSEMTEAIEGVRLLVAADKANDTLTFIGLDAAEPGYYAFLFAPASDPELLAYASVIASSIRNF